MVFPAKVFSDPYGDAAARLLRPLQVPLGELAAEVSDRLYRILRGIAETAEILDHLSEAEFARLKRNHAQHVMLLMSPDLTASAHQTAAQRLGQVHALVGVDILWLVEAYTLYQAEIDKLLRVEVPDFESSAMCMRILSQRILLALDSQVASYRRIDMQIASAFSQIDQYVMATTNLADLVRGTMAVIGKLEGGVSGFFARADAKGELQVEASEASAAETYQQAMEWGEIPRISIDPNLAPGQGPGGRAWRSGEIVVSDAWAFAPDSSPWHATGLALGFRSSAAVPLVDEAGRTVALLSLYSRWPGYFSTPRLSGFLKHVQQVLSQGIQQRIRPPVIPIREQKLYRKLLDEKRVFMLYQPVISLRDGRLVKLEALARLQGPGGEFISPQQFLPALRRDELLHLFTQGLEQACSDGLELETNGLPIQIAINFPAEGFGDPRYEQVLFQALDRCNFLKTRLQLEVLETEDASTSGAHQTFIQQLADAGVQIALDDLGSGHSSLLRLERYPFNEVKIDQGLVRGALRNPQHAIEFILHLTRLAHAFNIPVTVEGLENQGLIEAAAILGADRGQGYGIAKPMPVAAISGWYREYAYSIQPQRPGTAIGAMAGYLLWDMQLSAISDRPELLEGFVGAKALLDHFIESHNLRGSPLDALLTRNHDLARTDTGHGEWRNAIRTQVLEELTKYWLTESHE